MNSLLFKDFKNEFLKGVSSNVKNTQSSKVNIDADLGCLYANSYLEGKGEAYAVKCLVQAGHAAVFLQDIQSAYSKAYSDED